MKNNIQSKYTLVENKEKTWTGIGLTKEAGKYQGVVYRYGKVSVVEDEKNDKATLQFEWEVLDSNELPKEMFEDDFFELAGEILEDLIQKQIDQGDLQYVNTENRENDSQ